MALPEPGKYTVTRQGGITLTYTDFDAEEMAYDVNIHIPNGQSIEVPLSIKLSPHPIWVGA